MLCLNGFKIFRNCLWSVIQINKPKVKLKGINIMNRHWHDGIVVGASALQSVDLGFIYRVESYQKTLKNGIHSFPAWRSAK